MSRYRTTAFLLRSPVLAPVLAALLGALSAGCELEPEPPELEHHLNAEEIADNEDLAADATAQAQLAGALEMLFGTPENPRYLRLQEWVDDEYDPNRGDLRLSDAEFDALKESNRHHYRRQIAAIEAGDFDAVERPRYADELWRIWLGLREDMPEGGPDAVLFTTDDGDVTWREEAIYQFEAYYPRLATSAEMYRVQCYHCHGASGAGDGSTAPYLNPLPRDYRPGKFKFTALDNKARPRHEDLFRILSEGIYTTAMPSFRRFSDAQLHGLADYVQLLAMRGETEILTALDFDPDEGLSLDKLTESYRDVAEKWSESGEQLIVYDGEVPEPTPEAIERGRAHFLNEQGANCVSCHGVDGRGGGASAFERDPDTGELVPVKDDWGNPISPRDLRRGVFRFGRRPIDLYRRIHAGINGTPMPAHFGMLVTLEDGTQRPLGEDDVWDLVHFVRSLSVRDEPVHSAAGHADDGGPPEGH